MKTAFDTQSLANRSFCPRRHFAQLDVGFCSIVQRVTREVWGHLHLKLRAPVALVAEQEIAAAANIETQPLSCPQQNRLRGQANPSIIGSLGIKGWGTSVSIAISVAVLRLISIFRSAGRMVRRDSKR